MVRTLSVLLAVALTSSLVTAQGPCGPQSVNVDDETLIIPAGATWKYFEGLTHPSSGTLDWTTLGFDDTSWLEGPTGIGYGDGDDATVLTNMEGSYLTVYARFEFDLSGLPAWTYNSLRLRIDYDDGVRCYLNGIEFANRQLPSGPIDENTPADLHSASVDGGPDQIRSSELDLLDSTYSLSQGSNVLAIEIHNAELLSTDLSFIPSLFAYKRGPFLAIGSPTQTTVAFNTLDDRFGRIIYGTDPGNLDQTVTESIAIREHEMVLTGLVPGTTYYYQVLGAADASPTSFELFEDDVLCFETPVPGPDHAFAFAAFGDCGSDDVGEGANDGHMQSRVADLLPTLDPSPEFCLIAGDVIYSSGSRERFDRRHFHYYADTMATRWFYQALGNHDVRSGSINDDLGPGGPNYAFQGGSFARAFVLPRNDAEQVEERRELYYSFDWGPAHFVVLDLTIPSETEGRWIPPGTDTKVAMRQWASADLLASDALWKIVCFHHSPYTYENRSQSFGIDDDERLRVDFASFFEDHGVDLVIAGHEHFYERSYPLRYNSTNPEMPERVNVSQEPNYIEPRAPIYLVTGGGGRELTSVQPPQGGENFRSAVFSDHHVTTVAIDDNVLTLRAIDHTGTVRDTATVTKPRFVRGDADGDGSFNALADALFILGHQFLGGPPPPCLEAANADGDDTFNGLADALYVLGHGFLGGPPPPSPYPACGFDPDPASSVGCVGATGCP